MVAALIVRIAITLSVCAAQCHNNCNRNGLCTRFMRCDCFEGYEGVDCSRRSCPLGLAWSDIPSGDDSAHALATCSNRGHCDYSLGICRCDDLFEGLACDRLKCPNECTGHGECMSIAEAGYSFDGFHLNRSVHKDGSYGVSYRAWDAHKLFGCVCDPGFVGYDCSRLECDRGDDRRSGGGRDETIVLFCRCEPPCNGTLTLTHMGEESHSLSPSDTPDDLVAALGAMRFLTETSVEGSLFPSPIIASSTASTLCASGLGSKTTVTFVRDAGDLPPFYVQHELESPDVDIYFETNQTLNCSCAEPCTGWFSLEFDGQRTALLRHDATASDIQAALLRLENVRLGDVEIFGLGNFCSAGSFVVRFTTALGNEPALVAITSLLENGVPGGTVSVTTMDGTRERGYCNNAGFCDESGDAIPVAKNGTCYCDLGFTFDQDFGSCGRPVINTSAWTGIQRCSGYVSKSTGFEPFEPLSDRRLYVMDALNLSTAAYTIGNSTTYNGMAGLYVDNLSPDPTSGLYFVNHIFNLTNESAAGAALDLSYRFLYYVDQSIGGIRRYNLRNSSDYATSIVVNLSPTLEGLALNLFFGERTGYITDPGIPGIDDGAIYRFHLDEEGSNIINLTTTILASSDVAALTDPRGIALDLIHRTIYWCDSHNVSVLDGKVYRANLDGSSAIVVLERGLRDPVGIVLDLRNFTMFVADSTQIVKADMGYELRAGDSNLPYYRNQTWYQVIATDYVITNPITKYPIQRPYGLVIDTFNNYLYWTDRWAAGVFYSDTNGTFGNVYPRLFQSHSDPKGLAIDNGLGPLYSLTAYECYGHGYCGGPELNFRCICDNGWYGNCNMSYCPTGPAWFDQPSATDKAHAHAPCSNAGICDAATGTCLCRDGFEGAACERLACPSAPDGTPCSGHGACLTMRQVGLLAEYDGVATPYEYGSVFAANSTAWDADQVQHCVCRSQGYWNGTLQNLSDWTGYDCSKRTCPTGDVPELDTTLNGTRKQFETQQLTCFATHGNFTLTFRQATTEPIPATASLPALVSALRRLDTIGSIVVVPSSNTGPTSAWRVCNQTGASANITFTSELGDLPMLTADLSNLNGGAVDIIETVQGTKEDLVCSLHGLCDDSRGECACFDNYLSSDANGSFGLRNDCGKPGDPGALDE